jgi:hypothetical protein
MVSSVSPGAPAPASPAPAFLPKPATLAPATLAPATLAPGPRVAQTGGRNATAAPDPATPAGSPYKVGSYGTVSSEGQRAIRTVFGYDPGKGIAGAYTYDNGATLPLTRGRTGFAGQVDTDPATGKSVAVVWPDRAAAQGRNFGVRDPKKAVDLIATQEVAQRFLVVRLPRLQHEVVGDAVSVVQEPKYTYYLMQFTGQSLAGGVPRDYNGTANISLQALGLVAQKYGYGSGGQLRDVGRALLQDIYASTAVNGRTQIGAIDEAAVGRYGQARFNVSPQAFNADLQAAYRSAYLDASGQILRQMAP